MLSSDHIEHLTTVVVLNSPHGVRFLRIKYLPACAWRRTYTRTRRIRGLNYYGINNHDGSDERKRRKNRSTHIYITYFCTHYLRVTPCVRTRARRDLEAI